MCLTFIIYCIADSLCYLTPILPVLALLDALITVWFENLDLSVAGLGGLRLFCLKFCPDYYTTLCLLKAPMPLLLLAFDVVTLKAF